MAKGGPKLMAKFMRAGNELGMASFVDDVVAIALEENKEFLLFLIADAVFMKRDAGVVQTCGPFLLGDAEAVMGRRHVPAGVITGSAREGAQLDHGQLLGFAA